MFTNLHVHPQMSQTADLGKSVGIQCARGEGRCLTQTRGLLVGPGESSHHDTTQWDCEECSQQVLHHSVIQTSANKSHNSDILRPKRIPQVFC